MDTNQIEDTKTRSHHVKESFFHEANHAPIEILAVRLWLWDNVYAFAGVARSEKKSSPAKLSG